jgi:hypothetical protein
MIEVHISLSSVDITYTSGFPLGVVDEDTYNDLMSILWGLDSPKAARHYLMAVALYLMDNYESSSWRVVGFIGTREAGRLECLLPEGEVIPELPKRVSRYEREPVI